ncbi:MAG: dipeptidase [Ignavibacteriales bacterium]|nr:dipeptidase [Ignavibacteriaceae bacterium]NLH61875.1 dipeptidase [Ignavibacteriales bacterium]HOJ17922.1 dipeptidase [Ignavibacteriaceae bacterium]HPO54971.1 dipeptidase [Ignavibacteriaceae bacterium]
MERIINHINENKDNYVIELKEFLRIPSISTNEENKGDMQKCADYVERKMREAGLSKTKVFQTEGHPIVYGEWLGAKGKPTVLFYGHYDVQPVDPIELWQTPPFEPVVKDGKIWARGATDDKGQLFVHIKSVEAYLKETGELPLNVKFLIEGEEEIGSPSLGKFISTNKNLLKCDTVVISDTSLFQPGIPTLTYGLRGLSYLEVEVTGPDRDLHSGSYGGAVANPANVLIEMIAKLHDKNNKIMIPHFYDDVLKLTNQERENFKKLKLSDKAFAKEVGVKELTGEKGFTTLERIWARPTLDVNGIWGGFTGKGAKTIIPSKASAKFSMRLVPNQEPKKIAKLVCDYLMSIAPKGVKVKVTNLHGGYPVITPLEHKATKTAAKAMEKAFKKKTVFIREGGSIPVIATFATILKVPSVMMGLGLNSENLHSPNEHFDLKHFHLGILSSAYFMDEFSK